MASKSVLLTQRQNQVLTILISNQVPSSEFKLEQYYLGALVKLENKDNPERFPQAAHSLREIIEKMPDVMKRTVPQTKAEDNINMGQIVRPLVKDTLAVYSQKLPKEELDKALLEHLLKEIIPQFQKLGKAFPVRRDEHTGMLREGDPSGIPLPEPIENAVVQEVIQLKRMLDLIAHHHITPTEEDFFKHLDKFETFVINFFGPSSYEVYEELDLLIKKGEESGATKELVDEIFKKIGAKRNHFEHFMYAIESPTWFGPLKEKKIFSAPDKPYQVGENVGHPIWPQSQYLIKIAACVPPQELTKLILETKSENIHVHSDFLEIAIKLPPRFSSQVSGCIEEWLKGPGFAFNLPNRAAALLDHLLQNEQKYEAFKVAKILFGVKSRPRFVEEVHPALKDKKESVPKLSLWTYEKLLGEVGKKLILSYGLEALAIFLDILKESLQIESQWEHDASSVWRPHIDKSQFKYSDVNDVLLDFIFLEATESIATKKTSLESVIKLLEQYDTPVLRRLVLRLICDFFDEKSDLHSRYLLNPSLLRQTHTEYDLLLKKAFSSLPTETKNHLFSLIKEGVDREERVNNYWQYCRLSNIEDHLPNDLKEIFTNYRSEFGKIRENPGIIVRNGPGSPRTTEELRSLSDVELISFLKEWQPPMEHWDNCRDGLGMALRPAIEGDKDRFSKLVNQFKELHPTYVSALVHGLIPTENEKYNAEALLDLYEWVLNHKDPSEVKSTKNFFENREERWEWIWHAVGRGLNTLIRHKNAPPFHVRERIWKCIELLSNHENPVVDPQNERVKNHDSLAIGSVRGAAITAAFNYLYWVAESLKLKKESVFEKAPEIQSLLEKHLDYKQEPCASLNSIYGTYANTLTYWEKEWFKKHMDAIFPHGEANINRFNAAWEGYLHLQKDKETFELTKNIFKIGLRRTLNSTEVDRHLSEAMTAQLMIAFWHNWITAENDLLTYFFEKAPDHLLQNALWFIGHNLRSPDAPKGPTVIKKFQKLFESICEKSKFFSHERKKSLSAFSGWFLSRAFDKKWAITHLLAVLEVCETMDHVIEILEELVEYSPDYPEAVLTAADLLISKTHRSQYFFEWIAPTIKILTKLKDTQPKEFSAKLNLFIHKLGTIKKDDRFKSLLT